MTKAERSILKAALLKVERQELIYYKNLSNVTPEYSEGFEDRIMGLVDKKKDVNYKKRFIPKRIAIVAAAIILTFILSMSVSAIREPALRFIINIYDSFISIFVESEEGAPSAVERIEDVFMLTYIPSEFEFESNDTNSVLSVTTWLNDREQKLRFTQVALEGSDIHLDNPDSGYILFNIQSNYEVYYRIKQGYYYFIWSDGLYLFKLSFPDTLELSEVEKIIESMEAVENNIQ